jgi:hypothetical protein
LAEQSAPGGSWKPGGVTATDPGAGGTEACGAGASPAASAKQAATRTRIFINFQAPADRFEASV